MPTVNSVKEREQILAQNGYLVEDLDKRVLFQRPRTTYYGIDHMGKVKVMPNLPCDNASLKFYLRIKGYKLDPKDLTQTVAKAQEGGEFTCQVCGKVVSSKLALAGHKRTHQKINNNGGG